MVMVPFTTAKKERREYKYSLCRLRRSPSPTIKEEKGKKEKGKMRFIRIKKMPFPLSAQPKRTTIDDMIRSVEWKVREKNISSAQRTSSP